MTHQIPLLDQNTSAEAVIEPSRIIKRKNISPNAVLCFFHDVITVEAALAI